MAPSHVLRIPQGDNPDQFALLNVSQHAEDSLDLTLEGTEGNLPFVGNIHQSRLSKLLAKNSKVSLPEWEAILSEQLLRRETSSDGFSISNVELVANVDSNQMAIAFRKNISGIHQRVGEIVLKKDEQHEIDVLSWASTAVAHAASLEQRVSELSKKLKAHEDAVDKLRSQLEELQEVKKADEMALLNKFCETLNYKKAKIREQQYLLATAKIDKAKASQIRAARTSSRHRKPLVSRKQKRKPTESDSPSESGFESMSVDGDKSNESDNDASRADTPDEDTADDVSLGPGQEEGSDDLDASTAVQHQRTSTPSHRAKDADTAQAGGSKAGGTTRNKTPPKRNLPFTGHLGNEPGKAASGEQGGSARGSSATTDESSDDEL